MKARELIRRMQEELNPNKELRCLVIDAESCEPKTRSLNADEVCSELAKGVVMYVTTKNAEDEERG